MCLTSVITDTFTHGIPSRHPWAAPAINPGHATSYGLHPTRAEFDALKMEVAGLRELLAAAKKYDDATGQPNCEMDEKVALLKRVAELVGVDFAGILQAEKGE